MSNLSTTEKAALLRDVAIFARIAPRDLQLLAEMMEDESYRAGETVWLAGDQADRAYVVVSGTLDVRLPGRDDPVGMIRPGELFGELAMFAGEPRSASVIARTECAVLGLGYEPLREFLLRVPEAAIGMLEMVVVRFLEREREAWGKKPGA